MKKIFLFILFGFTSWQIAVGQCISNAESLTPFVEKLNKNEAVTQILFLGDSHIQADFLTTYLREKFQQKYGNAGRGLVFPYRIANSNGPSDFGAYSNATWENFRLVYKQDIFPQMGASGFVIGNKEDSFLEFDFKNPQDKFSKVVIFNDEKMANEPFEVYFSLNSLKDYVEKKANLVSYQVKNGQTLPELASQFYTTTTRLRKLNRSLRTPKAGQTIKTDKVKIDYRPEYETGLFSLEKGTFGKLCTEVNLVEPQSRFVLQTKSKKGNIFYGFQFLNQAKKGVVFNTVGVNGATYYDFIRYPLQVQQLLTIQPDIVMIALGTNESLSNITKAEFIENATTLIQNLRQQNPHLPIVLIAPTDNRRAPQKVAEITQWIAETAQQNNTAFLNLYQSMGGKGYFNQALNRKEANRDGVHFLILGYEKQAEKIWECLGYVMGK